MEHRITAGQKRRLELHRRKRQDYSGDVDVLWNFKTAAKIIDMLGIDATTATGVSQSYEVMKLVRKCKLIRDKVPPANESLADTTDDQILYAQFTTAAYEEEINACQ